MQENNIKYEDEIKSMSHEDFKKYCLKLSKEIAEYCMVHKLRIDYVVPILRSGAVPAVYISNELNLIKFAPIQVKKIKEDGIYDHIVLLNSLKDLNKDKELNLLVVEGTYSSGCTVNKALEEIRKTLPKSKIIFATICIRGKENMPKNIEKGFYGFDLPREKLFTYPWESVDMKEKHPDQKIENIFY
ncbi:MAG: phosphoribosyltransferase [Clostridia bacterium]|nr:phosphoribosyltransferase [Clostridia bacterium]